MAVDSRRLGSARLEPTAPPMGSVGGVSYGGGVGGGLELAHGLAAYGRASIVWMNGQGLAEEPTVFSIGGNAVPGVLQHRWDLGLTTLDVGLGLRYSVIPVVGIEATAGFLTTLRSTLTATETIASPTGVTFQDGSNSRTDADGAFAASRSVPTLAVRLFTTVPVAAGIALEPSAGIGMTMGSVATDATIDPTTVSFGIAIRWHPSGATPLPVPAAVDVPSPPASPSTATIADSGVADVPPVTSVPPFLDLHLDVFLMREATVVSGSTALSVRRHAVTTITWMEPGPSSTHGSVMPRRMQIHHDTIVDVDPPDIVIVPTIVADTAVERFTVRAYDEGGRLWDSTTTTVDTIRVPLSDWPIRWHLLREAPATIAVAATAYDVTGQITESVPASIRLSANEPWTDRVRRTTIVGRAPGFSGTASADSEGMRAVADVFRRYSHPGDRISVQLADAPAQLLQRQERSLQALFPGRTLVLIPTARAQGLTFTIERYAP